MGLKDGIRGEVKGWHKEVGLKDGIRGERGWRKGWG